MRVAEQVVIVAAIVGATVATEGAARVRVGVEEGLAAIKAVIATSALVKLLRRRI